MPSSIYSKVGSAFSTFKGSFCLGKVVILRYFACIGVVAVLRTWSVFVVPQYYIAPETALLSAYYTGFTFEFGTLILFSFLISDYNYGQGMHAGRAKAGTLIMLILVKCASPIQ